MFKKIILVVISLASTIAFSTSAFALEANNEQSSINPDMFLPCVFAGMITITNISTGRIVDECWVSGMGMGNIEGQTYTKRPLPKNQTYMATLTGGGTLGGLAWNIVPDCTEM